MQYNYDFEIASLFVMIIILLHFVFIRQFPSEKTNVFGMLLLACIFESCFNIASSIGLANAAQVPEIVNEVSAFAFFVCEGLSSYLIFRYFMAVGQIGKQYRKIVYLIGSVPFVLFELLVIVTPFTGFFYYFEDGRYYQGFGSDFGYWYVACYFVFNIILVFCRQKVVGTRIKVIMVIYTIVSVGFIAIQHQFRGILLTSAGNAVMLTMNYLAMQNPNEMLDPLTGIGNEYALIQQLRERMVKGRETSVIAIEIRKFQHIHTVLGSENSNEMMLEISRYLYELCGKFHVYYNGGALFSVLADSKEQGREFKQAICERFQSDWAAGQNHVVLNMDMVIQNYPKDFASVSDYFGMRNFLLEEAAISGNQAVIEADEAFIEKYRRRTQVEMAVAKAIHEKSFDVYYQPIYSLQEKRVVSLEALVRLNDEELGFIPPDEFIPLTERDGSIIHIGEIVLENCCRFLAKHVLSNVSLGIRTLHVNISMAQCLRQNLTDSIAPILEKYHIPPSMIILELTERTAVSTPEQMKRHMQELGKMGVSFAMDDYGNGNSNCSYLIQFPFQEIKIDKEITWAYFENKTARTVLKNEIKTIQSLGIPIVVEGIESREQSEQMEELGVNYIQGYYYGRPLPEKECLRYIRSFNSVPEEYGRDRQ